jgi:glycosyltransferase involved in cell wall biosynthesis
LFNWALKQANVVFVQNQKDADAIKETMGIEAVFIPNGHYIGTAYEQKRDSILWVGRTGEFKRPELFVNLAREFPNEKFVMICPRNRIGESYESLKLYEAGNIEFHEQVPFQQVEDYFQRAKVFVNTSDSEGFPNTFIQACKCSTPILSLNVNPDGFLDKYNCGTCADGDWKKFVDSLKFLLAEDRYIELGKNGRKYVEQNHDITKIIEEYKKLFIEAAEKHRKKQQT